jgi:hypothetical protein
MWRNIPPFSFSAGERKIMAHFVVNSSSHETQKTQINPRVPQPSVLRLVNEISPRWTGADRRDPSPSAGQL